MMFFGNSSGNMVAIRRSPKMFGNGLAEEYRLLVERLGFSRPELRTLILKAVSASWLPPERKSALLAEFTTDPAWQEG